MTDLRLDQTVRHHPQVSGFCPLMRLVLRLSSYPFRIIVELWQSLSSPPGVDIQPAYQPSTAYLIAASNNAIIPSLLPLVGRIIASLACNSCNYNFNVDV
jgi:hypothetical protein